jgi:hypothetical protein
MAPSQYLHVEQAFRNNSISHSNDHQAQCLWLLASDWQADMLKMR